MRIRAESTRKPAKASTTAIGAGRRFIGLQRKCACGGEPGLSGQCADCRRKLYPGVRAEPTINQPGDEYEREADRVADRVMRTPESPSAEPALLGYRFLDPANEVQGQHADGKHGRLEPKTELAAYIESMRGAGRPLDAPTRAFMEPRFGHEFSQVRIHTDARAAASADAVAAHAYALGRNIVFANGQYSPQTAGGKRLLAHELAHVLQQSRGGPVLQRASPGDTPPACPTDIKIAAVHSIPPINAQGVAAGWLSGGGLIAEMEVSDPTNRDWAGTKIHETMTAVKETCGKTQFCGNVGMGGTAGSTWPVGEAGSNWGMKFPSKRNTFYDWHISMVRYNVLGQEQLASCESECEQTYDCVGVGALRPKFAIKRSLTPDTVGTTAVTRIAATKTAKP
jgi:Domain of unknown function (DUF4157)